MRPIADLIETLRRAQVRIWSDGGNLHFRAPRGALTDALRAEMKQRKPELLEFLREAETSVSLPSIRRIERTDHPPVSLAQQRLWVLQQIEGPSPTYNIPSAVHLIGGLNVSAMENSLQAIVQRHESLRTTFLDRGGEVVQVISPRAAIGLPVTDLRSLSRAERHEEARRQIREESLRPFDLQDGPLVRFQLWLLSDDEHVLFVNVHHIVFDGMSIPVFLKELSELYQSFVSQTASQLPEPAVQFADYAQCQREWMKDDALQRQLDYWKQQLEGLPPLLELPTDFARPRVQTSSGRIHQSLVESETTGQLRRFAQESGTTLYTVLLSALSVLVARYTGREDIPVGCPVTNRNRPELDGLIGFFVNTLVLRTDLSDNPTFREFVERTRGTVLDGFASQELPFEHLVEALSPERNTSYTPLVQLTLMLLEGYENILQLPELEVRPFPFDNPISRFDLSLEVYESPQGLDVYWIYNRDLFESSTIERMSCNFERLLSDFPIHSISLSLRFPFWTTANADRSCRDGTIRVSVIRRRPRFHSCSRTSQHGRRTP